MAKFEVGDIVKAESPQAPLLRVVEWRGVCGYPHDCEGLFRFVPVHAGQVSFAEGEEHAEDFARVPVGAHGCGEPG